MGATTKPTTKAPLCRARRVVTVFLNGVGAEMTIECDLHLDHADLMHEADLAPAIMYTDGGSRILARWPK